MEPGFLLYWDPKILNPNGQKQLGTMTSGERGQPNATITACVNVVKYIPLLLMFSNINFVKSAKLKGVPPASIWDSSHFWMVK